MIQLNDTENFKVIIAEHDLTNENDCAYAVGVEEIIAHPAYNNTSFDGDFSILGKFEIRQSTIYYAGLLGRWDKWIVDQ